MKICLIFVLLFVMCSSTFADFYIDDGESVRWVRGDEDQFQAIKWEIRLYKRGDSPTGDRQWGLISGKYASSVTKQLNDNQKFEKKFEHWCNCPAGEFTYFNPLGPIAVLQRKPRQKTVFNKMEAVQDKIETVLEAHKSLYPILYPEGDKNPFEHSGGNLNEYAENLKDIFTMQEKFRKIEESISNSESYLIRRLGELSKDVDFLQKKINSPALANKTKSLELLASTKPTKSTEIKFVPHFEACRQSEDYDCCAHVNGATPKLIKDCYIYIERHGRCVTSEGCTDNTSAEAYRRVIDEYGNWSTR